MRANDYQKAAMRTRGTHAVDSLNNHLMNAALGLAGESGEVADLVKKYMYHGHVLDYDKLLDELGDMLWYLALACDALDVPLSVVMRRNLDKLKKRYPDGFSHEASRNRKA